MIFKYDLIQFWKKYVEDVVKKKYVTSNRVLKCHWMMIHIFRFGLIWLEYDVVNKAKPVLKPERFFVHADVTADTIVWCIYNKNPLANKSDNQIQSPVKKDVATLLSLKRN